MIRPLALTILPAATSLIGLLTEKNLLWVVIFFLVTSVIYFIIYFLKSNSSDEKLWSHFVTEAIQGFVYGATLVGQLACIGILVLWFL